MKKKELSLSEVLGIDETILKKRLTDLNLSVRSFNALKKAGLKNLEDVLLLFIGQSSTDFNFSQPKPKINNFGRKSQEEVVLDNFISRGILIEQAEVFLNRNKIPKSEVADFDRRIFDFKVSWSKDSQRLFIELRLCGWHHDEVKREDNLREIKVGKLVQMFIHVGARKKKRFVFHGNNHPKAHKEVRDFLIEGGYLE